MEMADNPKLEMSDSCDSSCGSENKTGTQKISVLDHVNGFQYESTDKSDSFVIDMESFCHGTNKDSTPNSRITLQRNLSRKGSMRSSEKKKNNTNFNTNKFSNERDTTIAALSPKGSSMPERTPTGMAVGATDDHSNNQQVHHQITITTAESRFSLRRNSFKRSTPSWILDPKRVLLIFATLSSMGTILLIYFTLSISKINTDDNVDWLQ